MSYICPQQTRDALRHLNENILSDSKHAQVDQQLNFLRPE